MLDDRVQRVDPNSPSNQQHIFASTRLWIIEKVPSCPQLDCVSNLTLEAKFEKLFARENFQNLLEKVLARRNEVREGGAGGLVANRYGKEASDERLITLSKCQPIVFLMPVYYRYQLLLATHCFTLGYALLMSSVYPRADLQATGGLCMEQSQQFPPWVR